MTGGWATIGAASHLYFSAYDEYNYDYDSPYGGGTYSNGTQFQYTANGTTVPVTNNNSCEGFATCTARDQYVNAVHHKGVVIAVGASMAFLVL